MDGAVLDGPSRELCQRLASSSLCTPHELQRSRRFVRRLARDLPMFDSVWIDALVRERVLTPFQAKVLDSSDPDRIRVGSCVLTDCLAEDSMRAIYRARQVGSRQRCLLTLLWPHPDDLSSVAERITTLIERLKNGCAESVTPPIHMQRDGDRIVVLSADVRGHSLHELLIRRGRFPATVVLAMARSIAAAIDSLERCGVAHGDLRTKNIRLGLRGELRLIHCGLLPAAAPDFAVNPLIPIDVCDGLAPELSTGAAAPDSRSDTYAMGCLLWQLLAGRPQFPTGDPLSKIAAHQSRPIPDVREFAPETPKLLAEFIHRATASRPSDRPPIADLARFIGSPGSRDRRQLRRFARTFQGEAPHKTVAVAQGSGWTTSWMTAVVLLGGVAFWLSQSGLSTAMLNISETKKASSGVARTLEKNASSSAQEAATSAPIRSIESAAVVATANDDVPAQSIPAMPSPAADGTVLLNAGKIYTAKPLTHTGDLRIRSTGRGTARVVATGWELAAESIHLEGIELLADSSAAGEPLLRAKCRSLEIVNSRIGNSESALAVEWSPVDAASADPGSIGIQNSVFVNSTVHCTTRPATIQLSNCLKTGEVPLLQLTSKGRAQRAVRIGLERVTLRESGPLVSWEPGTRAAGKSLAINANSCIFDLSQESALLQMDAESPPLDWERLIVLTGGDSIVTPPSRFISLKVNSIQPENELDASRLNADGLVIGDVAFRGTAAKQPVDSEATGTNAVRSAAALPGIDASSLPATSPEKVTYSTP